MRWIRVMVMLENATGLRLPVAPQGARISPPEWSNKDSHFISLSPHTEMSLDLVKPVICQRFQLHDDLVIYNGEGEKATTVQEGNNYYVAGFMDWKRGCPRVTLGQVDFAEGK
eukprot:TRINITY_DN335_c0_g1_i1.p1 TRINITY_DN335_c0_g1~~TRINITY_DN335_c0_g1_i1.p1  ORF type:complete len:113 (+),score=13.41 TRINITY_DN335_c0_g1_i1:51-389(+)